MTNKERGINLLIKRKAAGMTQTQLAEAIGKTTNTVSSYERGERFPRWQTLNKIADVLRCDARDLV